MRKIEGRAVAQSSATQGFIAWSTIGLWSFAALYLLVTFQPY